MGQVSRVRKFGMLPVLAGWILAAALPIPAADPPVGGVYREAMPHYHAGLGLERAGNLEAAMREYQAALAIGGDLRAVVGALVRTANIHMIRRDLEAAKDSLDEAFRRDPGNSDALRMQARFWILRDQPRRAVKPLEDLVRRAPDALSGMMGLVEAAQVRADPSVLRDAQARLDAALGSSLENRLRAAEQAREDAEFFAAADKPALAEFLASLSLRMDPSPGGKAFLAMAYYQSNRLDSAAALFQEISADPEFQSRAAEMLSQIDIQKKETQIEFRRAQMKALQAAVREAERAGRVEDAVRACEEIISFGRDVFAYEIREAESKLVLFKKEISEKTAVESRRKAFDLMKTGRHAEAAALLRQAKSVIGTDLLLDGMLAEALLQGSSNLTESEQEPALREILGLAAALAASGGSLPSHVLGAAHARLGLIMESRKRWPEALEQYTAARARNADMPDISRRLLKARIRARLPQVFLLLAAAAGFVGLTAWQWPRVYRTILAWMLYQVAIRQANLEREFRALKDLATLLPGRLDLRLKLAHLALKKGDEELGLYLLDQLRREHGLEKDDLVRLYELYERKGDRSKLYTLLDELLKFPLDAGLRIRFLEKKLDIEMEKASTRMALRTGQEILQIRPSAGLARRMADLTRADSDFKNYLSLLRTLIRLDPESERPVVPELEKILPAIESTDPELAKDTLRLLIDLHLRSGRQKRAAELLETLLPRESSPAPVLQSLLKIYTGLSETESVFRISRLLFEADTASLEFGFKYAALLELRGRPADALDVYLKILPHQPNNVELVRRLQDIGQAAFVAGSDKDLDCAVRIFREIIGYTFLDTKEIRLMLARCLMKKGRHDESIAILQAIEGGGYPRLRAQSLAAQAFLLKGQPTLAVDILTKIKFTDPQLTEDLRKEMRYLLADALEATGQTGPAAEIFDQLILEDITYRDVQARHARLARVSRAGQAQACPTCGKPNPAASRFCASCGSAIAPA
ncbi:tetratricopeptide repeat protein [bacterium]|nr:tetratricopeptide repeat protein [bacterium]